MPPTTPPTIGPTGVELVVVMGRVDDVEVGSDVEAGEGTLREVPTPEPELPTLGVTRKKSRMYRLVELAAVTMMSISWVPSASFGVWK